MKDKKSLIFIAVCKPVLLRTRTGYQRLLVGHVQPEEFVDPKGAYPPIRIGWRGFLPTEDRLVAENHEHDQLTAYRPALVLETPSEAVARNSARVLRRLIVRDGGDGTSNAWSIGSLHDSPSRLVLTGPLKPAVQWLDSMMNGEGIARQLEPVLNGMPPPKL